MTSQPYIPNPNYHRIPGMTFEEQSDKWSLQKLAIAQHRENIRLAQAINEINIIERIIKYARQKLSQKLK